MKRVDLTGQQFGRLTVLKFAGHAKNGNALWLCRCECGAEITTEGYRLRKGLTSSCGCYRRERMRKAIYSNEKTRAQMGRAQNFLIADDVNLVALTQTSAKNRSGVVGVSFDKQTGRWNARMLFRGHLVLNKRFSDFTAAVQARKEAEQKFVQPVLDKVSAENIPLAIAR